MLFLWKTYGNFHIIELFTITIYFLVCIFLPLGIVANLACAVLWYDLGASLLLHCIFIFLLLSLSQWCLIILVFIYAFVSNAVDRALTNASECIIGHLIINASHFILLVLTNTWYIILLSYFTQKLFLSVSCTFFCSWTVSFRSSKITAAYEWVFRFRKGLVVIKKEHRIIRSSWYLFSLIVHFGIAKIFRNRFKLYLFNYIDSCTILVICYEFLKLFLESIKGHNNTCNVIHCSS